MPVHQGGQGGLLDAYYAIPPVTRSLVTVLVASKLAMVLGVLPIGALYLSWPRIFQKFEARHLSCC